MASMHPFCPGLVFGDFVVEIAAGYLPDLVLRAHDDGKLLRVMLLRPGPVTDECGEEAGKAVRLMSAGRFQVSAKRFGSHIDAVDRLRVGPARRGVTCVCRRVPTRAATQLG